MKVAITADWLIGGGAERVVEQLHKMFPEAPIYTSYATKYWKERLDDKVVTGYLQNWPFWRMRKFIPFLRAHWFSRLNLRGYDLIISSSGAEAKFVRTKLTANSKQQTAKPLHVAYIHAPTHYYWDRYEDYLKNPGFGFFNWLARLGLKILVGPMRQLDYKAAQQPDYLIANSSHTKQMIKKYYGRDSVVIHPPVDVERFQPNTKYQILNTERHGFVVAGRQTPYKRIDLAVRACTKLSEILTVIGDGPEHKRLRKMAGPTINFIKNVPDSEMPMYFRKAKAFIFPGLDDFGIVAVEAMAGGTPVIAYKAGGALDYVEAKTGLFFDKQTPESLSQALKSFDTDKFDTEAIAQHAEQFSAEQFSQKLKNLFNLHKLH